MKDYCGAIKAMMKRQSSKLNPQPKRTTQLNEVIVDNIYNKKGEVFMIYDNNKRKRIIIFASPMRVLLFTSDDEARMLGGGGPKKYDIDYFGYEVNLEFKFKLNFDEGGSKIEKKVKIQKENRV